MSTPADLNSLHHRTIGKECSSTYNDSTYYTDGMLYKAHQKFQDKFKYNGMLVNITFD